MKLLSNISIDHNIKNALIIDAVYGIQAYETDHPNEVLYYKEFNNRYRLSRSTGKRIWLSGFINEKDLGFCIMQAINIATKNTHYVDYLDKSTFSELQKKCIQKKDIEYSSILVSPQWEKHISYITDKLPKHNSDYNEYRVFCNENIDINEIYLIPSPEFVGIVNGVNDEFNLMVYNGCIMHRVVINRFPHTVERYFQKMMEEALE